MEEFVKDLLKKNLRMSVQKIYLLASQFLITIKNTLIMLSESIRTAGKNW